MNRQNPYRCAWRCAALTILLFVAAGLLVPQAWAQQTGTLTGVVRDLDTNESLVGANVVVEGTQRGSSTDADGEYRIENVPAGSQTLRVTFIGYETERVDVTVVAGETTPVNIVMTPRTFVGDEVVVTGSKRPEKLLDAPVQIEAISAEELSTTGGGTFLSALGNLKGVDFVDVGINGQGISARGFNNHFNTRLLSMVDGRLAQLPGTGLPQGNFLPTSQLDVQSIEVVVGPASALYGPNAHTGVVNVITKDPWDDSSLALDVRGGGSQLFDVNGRVAGTANDWFGWKVTGQYLSAEDFQPPQPGSNPEASDFTHTYATSAVGPLLTEQQIVDDYDVQSIRTEGGLYARFLDDWQLELTAGFSENDNFGLTNNGRNRILGWQVNYQNVQLSSENWYLQATRTANDAGDTYQIGVTARAAADSLAALQAQDPNATLADVDLPAIKDNNTFVDKGELLDSEVQYRNTFGSLDLTTGVQARQYNPDSEGTFLADANNEDIDATEVGGYLQLDYRTLDDRLRLNVASRLDNHSDYDTQFSPKAAAVYSVAPNHNVRVGYNQAFKSPTILESNLLIAGVLRGNIDGYTIRSGNTADAPVVSEIDPLEPEQVQSLELGYKGVFGKSVFVDVVAYNSWYENFISPLTPVANGAETFAFDANGDLVAGIGVLQTYFNFGEATVRGLDVGLDVYASEHLNVTSSVSYIDLADFTAGEEQGDLLLNVPEVKLKGSITLRNYGFDHYFVSLSGRWQSEYEFGAGYWQSAAFYPDNDGKVPSRFTAGATVGYSLPAYGVSITGNVSNLFNTERVDVLGSPVRDRLFWIGATYKFDGLNF
jgi:outer membrane receptor for ferrienterochelin and colicins